MKKMQLSMKTNIRLAALPYLLILVAALLMLFSMVQTALAGSSIYSGETGYDIAYPQKSGPYPSGSASNGQSYAFGIIGVNNGKPFTMNPYLATEYAYVVASTTTVPSFYMNTAYPVGSTASQGKTGPLGNCAPNDKMCQSFNYGYNFALYACNGAISATHSATATTWWLDVETANSWSPNTSYNAQVLSGAISYLQTAPGVQQVGIYSTQYMFNKITGGHQFDLPIWVAGAASLSSSACGSAKTFNGGPVWLVQYWNSAKGLDEDLACN